MTEVSKGAIGSFMLPPRKPPKGAAKKILTQLQQSKAPTQKVKKMDNPFGVESHVIAKDYNPNQSFKAQGIAFKDKDSRKRAIGRVQEHRRTWRSGPSAAENRKTMGKWTGAGAGGGAAAGAALGAKVAGKRGAAVVGAIGGANGAMLGNVGGGIKRDIRAQRRGISESMKSGDVKRTKKKVGALSGLEKNYDGVSKAFTSNPMGALSGAKKLGQGAKNWAAGPRTSGTNSMRYGGATSSLRSGGAMFKPRATVRTPDGQRSSAGGGLTRNGAIGAGAAGAGVAGGAGWALNRNKKQGVAKAEKHQTRIDNARLAGGVFGAPGAAAAGGLQAKKGRKLSNAARTGTRAGVEGVGGGFAGGFAGAALSRGNSSASRLGGTVGSILGAGHGAGAATRNAGKRGDLKPIKKSDSSSAFGVVH